MAPIEIAIEGTPFDPVMSATAFSGGDRIGNFALTASPMRGIETKAFEVEKLSGL